MKKYFAMILAGMMAVSLAACGGSSSAPAAEPAAEAEAQTEEAEAPEAESGKADMAMAGLTVTEERMKNVDFTESYATGVQVIIVPEGSDIQTVDDLANDKMIGVQDGTTGYIYCSASVDDGGYGEDHVTSYTNGAMAIEALKGGKVDAVVIDNEPAKAFVAVNDGLKILDTEYIVENYAIGISKDNPALCEAVNNALKELIADGSVQMIVDKYITAE